MGTWLRAGTRNWELPESRPQGRRPSIRGLRAVIGGSEPCRVTMDG
jgi:hypothetical protein